MKNNPKPLAKIMPKSVPESRQNPARIPLSGSHHLGSPPHPSAFSRPLIAQGPWNQGLLKPAASWSADPATRYTDSAIVHMRNTYTNPNAKRLFKGAALTPPRILAMQLKSAK